MWSRLLPWIDAIPEALGPVERARVRVQHLIVLLMQVIGLPYAVTFVLLGMLTSGLVNGIVFLGSIVALLGLTRRGYHRLGGMVISVGFFFTITTALVARGGMTSNSAAWLLLSPVLAFMMAGPRHGIVIGFMAASEFVLFWALETVGVPFETSLDPNLAYLLIPFDYAIIAATISLILWAQAGIWDGVIARLDLANQTLTGEISVREEAEAKALAAAKARYTFLATMSHEIRTPLNGVLGLTEVMLHGELNAEQRELATTVRHSGQLLRALLDDVLDFSKIDSGRLDLESVPLDLRRLCEDIVRLWQGPATERGLDLAVQWEAGAPAWVHGDPTRLRQILGNLVSNAIKFTEAGYVHIRVAACDDRLQIAVADTGQGIPESALDHIFEPFRQADSSTTRKHGGTGLGLAICRRLATALGGELSVRSTLGEGTVFRVSLPLDEAEPDEHHSLLQDGELDLTGLRVLVAEDNPVNRMVVRKLLERFDLEVVLAENGEQCVAAWQQVAPDMVLMDCQMPVCDGYEATRRLRALGADMPIVALTANTMPGDRARCLAAGMDDHLGKPIRPDELEAALARWIGGEGERRGASA